MLAFSPLASCSAGAHLSLSCFETASVHGDVIEGVMSTELIGPERLPCRSGDN